MKKLSNRFAKLCLLASAIAIVAAVFQLFYSVKLGRVAYIAENVSWVKTFMANKGLKMIDFSMILEMLNFPTTV